MLDYFVFFGSAGIDSHLPQLNQPGATGAAEVGKSGNSVPPPPAVGEDISGHASLPPAGTPHPETSTFPTPLTGDVLVKIHLTRLLYCRQQFRVNLGRRNHFGFR